MIPYSYPRILQEEDHSLFGYIMIGLGAFATVVVVATTSFVTALREKAAIRYAQLDFLYLILTGSFLASIGAILSSVPPTNGSCMVRFYNTIRWFDTNYVQSPYSCIPFLTFGSFFSSEYRMVLACWIYASIASIGGEGIRHQSDGSRCKTHA
jgi:hypothetical protein